jgi:hypothetical protein
LSVIKTFGNSQAMMKSSKHRKAEDLIARGQKIRIIGESDFLSVMGL